MTPAGDTEPLDAAHYDLLRVLRDYQRLGKLEGGNLWQPSCSSVSALDRRTCASSGPPPGARHRRRRIATRVTQ